MDAVVPLYDSQLTGDQIIDILARLIPFGAHGAVMGVQNIKGTGLDFVYRWVSHDVVTRALTKLETGNVEDKQQAIRELTVHDDYGLMDAKMGLARLEAFAARNPGEVDPLIARLREIVRKRGQALTASRQETVGDKFRRFIGKTFDYMDSIRRQHMATAVIEDLVHQRISHAAAAIRMRDVVARAKGAWMTKKSGS
jgi:gamma-polyglutamate synthase